MEPLHPDLRSALKDAHPSLTDEDIDKAEELLNLRMACDPERESDRIAQLDRERIELIQERMPRYAEVSRLVKLAQDQQGGRISPNVTIRERRPEATEERA